MSESTDTILKGCYLPTKSAKSLWDVTLRAKSIRRIEAHECHPSAVCEHKLLLPGLCHPHIHLDKAFLLSSNSDRYGDLAPKDGTFSEALKNTAAAKARFTAEDLYERGSWLIDESIGAGVTAMRAFVEVDETVGLLCLETGIKLKMNYEGRCVIQLCAFAQDPIFSGERGEGNRALMEGAMDSEHVAAVGTTPYVESGRENSMQNIHWAISTALKWNLHLDFHLDYNLDVNQAPMVVEVVKKLVEVEWTSKTSKTIAIGHCTKITQLAKSQVRELAHIAQAAALPLSFIGLPTSDLYMMGRQEYGDGDTCQRPRGTINIPLLIQEHGFNGAIGINNVGNAFTPYGNLDPLWLACLGVGLYHRGTAEDARLLFECVSTRARRAIGLPSRSLEFKVGDPVDFMVVDCLPLENYRTPPGRLQITVEEIVWSPPPLHKRRTLLSGELS